MPKNTNLVPLPMTGPENLFENVVNRHHDEVKAEVRAEVRRKREKFVTRWLIAALLAGMAASAYAGFLIGASIV